MSLRPYVRVPASSGEPARKKLLELGLLDTSHKIISEEGFLFLPLSERINKPEISDRLGVDSETGNRVFEPMSEGPRTLVDALSKDITEEELEMLPRAYDLVGEIAVLEIPEEIEKHSKLIGEAFHSVHPRFRTILAKRGAISGTTRTRDYELLWGEDKTKTIHTEYGCRLVVDLEKAYFSPRLLEEHSRVARLVEDGERVIDMFCGVGPFAIQIAKQKKARVIAVDINPDAISLLKESLEINRLVGEVIPIVADTAEYLKTLEKPVDRVIMNHPSGAQDFVHSACSVLTEGGTMHYYDFVGASSPEQELQTRIRDLVNRANREVSAITLVRRVRDSAPYEYQMVADVIIR
jgi:tRNA (guanine37-N1)-methyltransferase